MNNQINTRCLNNYLQKIKNLIKENWVFYLAGLLVLFGLKYFYSKADSNDLTWLLAPTVWWVRTLSGIPFVYDSYDGYVNHTYQFVIAPSCSGMQFMVITLATLIFSFIHKMNSRRKKAGWMICSLLASYVMTILVNTIRIIISIYLPVYIETRTARYTLKSLSGGLLTPERLHTLIGTFVYFTSLLIIYQLAGLITRRSFRKCLSPVFFYLALVIGVPFLNRAYQNNKEQFTEYVVLISLVCLIVLTLYHLGAAVIYHFRVRSR